MRKIWSAKITQRASTSQNRASPKYVNFDLVCNQDGYEREAFLFHGNKPMKTIATYIARWTTTLDSREWTSQLSLLPKHNGKA